MSTKPTARGAAAEPPAGDTARTDAEQRAPATGPDRARPAPGADRPPGRIEVTPRAIITLATRAIEQSYGVVGLASRHATPGLGVLLRREEQHQGIQVNFSGDRVVIDLYVILEYGTRISEVAYNLMSAVKFAVESALEMPAVEVNVNVQGIRVSK